ncbi:MAG TPA: oxygen-independent coproporphyrinogen III oxidase [Devosia sp.]
MTANLVDRYARPVPRYTSYPTAPQFGPEVNGATYESWLRDVEPGSTLSLYLHIPFCDRLCWFCGCHTKQVLRYDPIAAYLGSLHREIELVSSHLGDRATVTAIHLGGGSPSMLAPDDMASLGGLLRRRFNVSPSAEISIEIDPNDMNDGRYDGMAALGVTRASIGVQDFDHQVQVAINRTQTFEQTAAVVQRMRADGVRSVNLDVLYGLPHQTIDKLSATIEQALSLEPDRLALFGYAHVPWMKTHQRMIDETALPGTQRRFEQARSAAATIVAAGYMPIGIDHFAKPSDSLARAARSGRLHRNFQGYTTDDAVSLIGLGASSIGQLLQGYVQNITPTGEYRKAVDQGILPTARGIALTTEDKARAFVIERLMCDFAVSLPVISERFPEHAAAIIEEMRTAVSVDQDGIVELQNDVFALTPTGRPFVRSVAAGFDTYLQRGEVRYSIAV